MDKIISGLITALISSIIGGIIADYFELIPLYGIFIISFIILILILIYHLISFIRKKRLLFEILPKKEIAIPVEGRKFTIVIYNKNKFDIKSTLKLEFPLDILNIMTKDKRKLKKFKTNILIESMNEKRINFNLLPREYNRKGFIYYDFSSTVKNENGKIEIST